MLDELFLQILDMSKVASVAIVAVMLARLLLKKAPKWISYALWAVVLMRLVCPVSVASPVSIVPEMDSVSEGYTLADEPISVFGAGEAAYRAVGDALNGGLGTQYIRTTEKTENGEIRYVTADWRSVWILVGQYVWVAGMSVMALYSAVSYAKLRRSLRVCALLRENIFVADDIRSPFVIGLVKAKIYLPCGLGEQEREYIILHEQHHIRRLDHIIKALAFFVLTLHWFNPLVWAAFVLACRDMEMSCDEAVIDKLGAEIRADYSASLLTLATGRRIIAGVPLAFGEGDTRGRIKNLANWKKPALWGVVAALVVCVVLAICLLTDPQDEDIGNETMEKIEQIDLEPTVQQESTEEMIRRIVNSILVGALSSDDEHWQPNGAYTLSVFDGKECLNRYVRASRDYYQMNNTPGFPLEMYYTWSPCEDDETDGGYSITFDNGICSFTVYSENNRIKLTENGKTMYFFGSVPQSNTGCGGVFRTFQRVQRICHECCV